MGHQKGWRQKQLGLNDEDYAKWVKARLSAGGKSTSSNFAANRELASRAGSISKRRKVK